MQRTQDRTHTAMGYTLTIRSYYEGQRFLYMRVVAVAKS